MAKSIANLTLFINLVLSILRKADKNRYYCLAITAGANSQTYVGLLLLQIFHFLGDRFQFKRH